MSCPLIIYFIPINTHTYTHIDDIQQGEDDVVFVDDVQNCTKWYNGNILVPVHYTVLQRCTKLFYEW